MVLVASLKFEDFVKEMVKAASDTNHVPYSVLLVIGESDSQSLCKLSM